MNKKNTQPQLLSKAFTLHQSGKLGDAEALYRSALVSDPKNADALTLLGVVCLQRGKLEEGVRQLENSLRIKPHQPDVLKNLGNALRELKRYDDAVIKFDQAITLRPDAEAYFNRGNALQKLERYDEALASFDKAIALRPGEAEAYFNRGNALQKLGRYDESLASFDKAIALKPNLPIAHNNRGVSLRYLKRYSEALASFDKAVALKADYAKAYNNRGNVLQQMKRYDDALLNYGKALAINPESAETCADLTLTLQDMKRYDESLQYYEKAIALKADTPYLDGSALHTKMQLCYWQGIEAMLDALEKGIDADKPVSLPFPILATPISASRQKRCAESFVRDKYPPAATPMCKGERYAHDKIRIGYFSSDFHDNHPIARVLVELFERHDRSCFELAAFSFCPPTDDPLRKRMEKAFAHFLDVHTKSDLEIAQMARKMEIDIAIDLNGFTAEARTGLFAQRFAPVQVNYLGYPGTMGAGYIDYIIADREVIPEAHKQYYAEQVVHLPHTYWVTDTQRQISDKTFTRRDMGLPEKGFIFCCFNSSYKITPDVFTIWMRLLQKIPGSVLWLSSVNPSAAKNLSAEAEARGIAANRLVFAKRMDDMSDHLARHRLADLFLDTFYYNAHTTASDALWAGLPVLTCIGESFAARVAASLLNAIGLPEMVTHSHADYEALALELATHPEKLSAIKAKLAQNRETSPLFNTALFARNIEAAYIKMWERSQGGLPPEPIDVEAVSLS